MANTGSILLTPNASSFAARRVETMLGRAYSLALVLTGAEMTINALDQAGDYYPVAFWLFLGLTWAAISATVVSFWFFQGDRRWYLVHSGVVLANLVLWPLMVLPQALPLESTPFVSWSLGMAALSAGLGLRKSLAAVVLVAIPAVYFFIRISPYGELASWGRALQEASYDFLFSATFTVLIALLRYRALEQDKTDLALQDAAVVEATKDAKEREWLRVTALVHNQVLGALNLALEANSPAEQVRAAQVAKEAATQLVGYAKKPLDESSEIQAEQFFTALAAAVEGQSADIKISTHAQSSLSLPAVVAESLTQATMQALSNSLTHAGAKGVTRALRLKVENGSIKIVVIDDGRGFRASRVPKNRLGIRILIQKAMESVGGTAHINSKPNEGTTVILEWKPNV